MPTCPDCDGKGKTGPVHINRGSLGCEWKETMPCLRCKGSGEIPEKMILWMARGQQHQRNRIDREESLFECAKRLGLRPSELSAMEHGRRDPAPLFGS